MKRMIMLLSVIFMFFLLVGCNRAKPLMNDDDYGLAQLRDLSELQALYEASNKSRSTSWDGFFSSRDASAGVPEMELDDAAGDEGSTSYSRTNVQVEGVDEGDIIKTDGNRIYRIKYNLLQVVDLLGDGEMEVVLSANMQTVSDTASHTYFSDLYLTSRYLVVIGQRYHYFTMRIDGDVVQTDEAVDIMPGWFWYGTPQTLILVYDLENLELVDEIEINGHLMTTRLIDDDLYVLSSQDIYLHDEIDPRPLFRQNDDVIVPEYGDIKYHPDVMIEAFTIIAQIKLEEDVVLDYDIFLGSRVSWSQVYVSKEAIYMASTTYSFNAWTNVYTLKGHLISYVLNDDGSVSYGGTGTFKGYPINQFAMDEYEGYFRMVTTEGWGDSVKNRLYVFERQDSADKRTLEVIGLLDEGLGKPRETVRSVRFSGNLVTVVTFEQIDPFYTIDLSDPANPVILGELEIPGFSTYQHPWGDDYIIGIGFETDANGIAIGLKLSLYDISDVLNPVEVGEPLVLLNGESGWNYSEALHNHKAILIAEALGFIGFAMSRSHWTATQYHYTSDYLIFEIDPESETPITIAASLSHLDLYLGDAPWYHAYDRYAYDFSIERAVYVDDYLYVVSGEAVTSHDMNDGFARVRALRFMRSESNG